MVNQKTHHCSNSDCYALIYYKRITELPYLYIYRSKSLLLVTPGGYFCRYQPTAPSMLEPQTCITSHPKHRKCICILPRPKKAGKAV